MLAPGDLPTTSPPPQGKVAGAATKLTIGLTVANSPIVVPPGFTLRVYTVGVAPPSFSARDRFNNQWNGNLVASQQIAGMPYWNGTSEQTANGVVGSQYVDFDGRTFAEVTPSASNYPWAMLLTDPAAPMPRLQ